MAPTVVLDERTSVNRYTLPLSLGAFVLLATSATLAPTTVRAGNDPCHALASKYQRMQCRQSRVSAPGDEYFGRMKLSYLGIENTFHDTAIQAGAFTTSPGIIGRLGFADEALSVWTREYPKDPELARAYFLAVRVYQKVYTQPAQAKSYVYMIKLAKTFPSTYFGKIVRKDLEIGFTEHWYATPVSCSATPGPQETPTPIPTGKIKVIVFPSDCLPTPSPSPTPR